MIKKSMQQEEDEIKKVLKEFNVTVVVVGADRPQ
eukprot:CAMPEP_0116986844 /NCGR_PEP_ID=MMETSP0467-20121206/63135_1 /TAXON_ID=283647 /ORGANISM="Mesodinium pulex, Strain SPMC105" /LENGTH=33 /DNA_ID= /DNA_START= /DNA_END= /DNA_ORIENTATION=